MHAYRMQMQMQDLKLCRKKVLGEGHEQGKGELPPILYRDRAEWSGPDEQKGKRKRGCRAIHVLDPEAISFPQSNQTSHYQFHLSHEDLIVYLIYFL